MAKIAVSQALLLIITEEKNPKNLAELKELYFLGVRKISDLEKLKDILNSHKKSVRTTNVVLLN